jgi:hypothetical protein
MKTKKQLKAPRLDNKIVLDWSTMTPRKPSRWTKKLEKEFVLLAMASSMGPLTRKEAKRFDALCRLYEKLY